MFTTDDNDVDVDVGGSIRPVGLPHCILDYENFVLSSSNSAELFFFQLIFYYRLNFLSHISYIKPYQINYFKRTLIDFIFSNLS